MNMLSLIPLLLVLTTSTVAAQAGDSQVDSTFYAVSYVEVAASSRAAAVAAFKQYRVANQRLAGSGFVRLDTFEQIGRPGHFALVETWRDQKALDARDQTVQGQLFDALKGIRVSGYDQRPYKTLTVGPAPPATGNHAIVVVSHVDVTPNPQVPVMLRRLADASRPEQGNLRFDVLQHTMRANHFTVIEAWRDQKAFDAHVGAAHTKQYRDELQPMTGSPLDERVYQVVD
jgi:quinol monooxygenase YgiN